MRKLTKKQEREFLLKCEGEVRTQAFEAAFAFFFGDKDLINREPYDIETPEDAHKRSYFAGLVYDGIDNAANAIFGDKAPAMRYFISDLIRKIKSGEFESDLNESENDLKQHIDNMFDNSTGVFEVNDN